MHHLFQITRNKEWKEIKKYVSIILCLFLFKLMYERLHFKIYSEVIEVPILGISCYAVIEDTSEKLRF